MVYQIAEDQLGYFTAAQARAAGVKPGALIRMAERGTVTRVSRGVYRLRDFPASPYSQLMAASLWPEARGGGVRGVISHASALSLYDLSDVDPVKVDLTLPRRTRISRSPPSYVTLHRARLPDADIHQLHGIPVTTPERTIRDCSGAGMSPSIVAAAISDAEREGWLKQDQAARLREELLAR